MKPWQQTLTGFLLGLVVVGAIILIASPQRGQSLTLVTVTPNLTPNPTSTLSLIRVHVTGSVNFPGVYSLPESARMDDAIQAAGGLKEGVDPEWFNLAAVLTDGQRLFIPASEEAFQSTETKSLSVSNTALININTASIAELDSLPGIGEVKAQAIFNYRQQNGLFTTLEDLLKVQGINSSLFEEIKSLVTLGE